MGQGVIPELAFLDQAAFFAQLMDRRLRSFGRYWLNARANRKMLERRALDPTEFPSALPIIVLSRMENGLHVYELAGENINRYYGCSTIVGLTPNDVASPDTVERVRESLSVVQKHGAARYSRSRYNREDGYPVKAERLLLPLSDNDETVDHTILLVALNSDATSDQGILAHDFVRDDFVNYWKTAPMNS